MTIIEPLGDFGGTLVGRYWVRWLGTDHRGQSEYERAVKKLDSSPGLVQVEVRRFSVIPGVGRYVVRVPGYCGYFGLSDFEWHGYARDDAKAAIDALRVAGCLEDGE